MSATSQQGAVRAVTPTPSLFLRSVGAGTVSQVWRVGVRYAVEIVLRRLILTTHWGLWGWGEPLFLLLGQVRDLGLPGHVVRSKVRPYGNFLAVELLWGGATAALVWLGAPLLALAYSEANPEVVPVLRALTLFLFLEGLAKVPLTYFEAEIEVGRTVLPEVARNLTFAAVSVVLALQGHGVWSLIVAHIAGVAVFAASLWWRAFKHRMPLTWVPGATLPLVRASLPLVLISLLILLSGFVDPFVLAARFSGSTVGIYNFALLLAFLVARQLALPINRALFPTLVKLGGDRRKQFEAYRLATLFLLAVEVPAAMLLFANAELVVRILGGEQWPASADFLRILCFAPLIQPFSRCANELLMSRHQDRVLVISSLLTLLALGAGGIALTARLGAVGMAWANFLPLGAAVSTWAIYRISPPGFRALLGDLARVYLLPAPLFLIAYFAAGDHAGWRLALSIVAAALGFAAYVGLFAPRFRRFFAGG